jgi:formylglycine-generating enzyme required for sulfatase activity
MKLESLSLRDRFKIIYGYLMLGVLLDSFKIPVDGYSLKKGGFMMIECRFVKYLVAAFCLFQKRFRLLLAASLLGVCLMFLSPKVMAAESTYSGEMVFIPAGPFLMGNNGNEGEAGPSELPQHSVDLPGYWIGKHEVTRGEYQQFIDAGGYSNAKYWSDEGWNWKGGRTEPSRWAPSQDWYGGPFIQTENHPAMVVTYYEAEAFCNWAGVYIPTEAQWEKAARWTESHSNVYPWGDMWDAEKCNNYLDHNPAGGGYERFATAPVASYQGDESPYGCRDMAGNVWEWCREWFKSYPGSESPFDYTNKYRVLRGGSWYSFSTGYGATRSSYRYGSGPGYTGCLEFGFRVACDAANMGWQNSLKPKGKPAPELLLASAGKTLYNIVLPKQATSQEEKAAEDLAHWLTEMAEADFKVLHEGPNYKTELPFISIGNTTLAAKVKLAAQFSDIQEQGYAIDAVDGNLYLRGGKTRGIINAVYALLEEDLGCRWYAKNTSTIPHRPELSFKPVLRLSAPAFPERRDPYYSDCLDTNWRIRNRTYAVAQHIPEKWGGHAKYFPHYGLMCHTFNFMVPRDEFFESHPEYFSQQGGQRTNVQLCMSNPDVKRIAIERILKGLRETPGVRMCDFSPNDGGTVCECAPCKKINDTEGTNMGALLMAVNTIADAIKKEFPDVKISTLAYMDTFVPPKTIKPRDNVLIWLAADSHNWRTPLLPVWETMRFQAAVRSWDAIGANMVIWEYPIDYFNWLSPILNMPVVTENMRFYAKNGVKGMFIQGTDNPSHGVDRSFMRSWAWSKQMWDLSLDTRTLVRDFNYGYYGKAAEPMQAYDDMLWDMWEKHHEEFRTTPGWDLQGDAHVRVLNAAFVESGLSLIEQAEELAHGDQQLSDRVQIAKLPLLYLKAGNGPGPDKQAYLKMIDEFEVIARKNNVDRIQNGLRGPDIDAKLAQWRSLAQ